MRSSSKAGLFLVELIIVIAFFSLASAHCMRLFAYSHVLGNKSENLNMAINATQSAAEIFRASGGNSEHILRLLAGSEVTGENITVDYNKQWQPDASGDFCLTMQIEHEDAMAIATIVVTDTDGDMLYSLLVYYYNNGTEATA